jgi:hypothetical protein
VATESEHLAQARENLRQADELDPATWVGRQWMCTIYYYVAIHCVEAALASRAPSRIPPGSHGSRHEWREAWMALNTPAEVSRSFRALRTTSNRARYDLVRPTPLDVQRCAAAARAMLRRAAAHQLAE